MIFGLVSFFISFLLFQIFNPEKINLIAVIPSSVLILNIIFWAALIILLVVEILYLVIGLEVVELNNDHIVIEHRVMRLGISRKFHYYGIDGVFVSRLKIDWLTNTQLERGIRFADFKKGLVAINYGKNILGRTKTFRFGSILTREEAVQIVTIIHQRFPQYKYHSSINRD